MSRAQDSLYVHQPPAPSVPVRSIGDYLERKFDSKESKIRAERYESVMASLVEMDKSIRQNKLAANRSSLVEWLSTETSLIHTSFVVNTDYKELLQLENNKVLGHENWFCVNLWPAECPNVKMLVKNVVQRLTKRAEDSDADRRLLYDFDLIKPWLADKGPDAKVVIVLEGADVFIKQVIAGFYNYVATYEELPIRVVLSISLSPSIFEEQLLRHTVELFDCRLFETETAHEYVQVTLSVLERAQLRLGPDLVAILETQPLAQILRIVRYMLMSHFTSNPIALLNVDNARENLGLVRRLPSFRRLKNFEKYLDDDALELLIKENVSLPHHKGFLSELVINNVDLYYTAFEPHYRHALETALSEPSFYYPFEEPRDLRSRVAVCLLYSLVRGSDLYLNIYETYLVFRERMVRPANLELDDEQWARISVAWFQQAVVELTQMGIVRNTKRKANSLEKAAFKGV